MTSGFSLHGLGVSQGVVIGRALVLSSVSLDVPHYHVDKDQIDQEVFRLTQAIRQATDDIQLIIKELPGDTPYELTDLLNVHSLILQDPTLLDAAIDLIQHKHYNAEWALTTQAQTIIQQFDQMEDEYLQERGNDVRQVVERIIDEMTRETHPPKALSLPANEPMIVVAHDISPSDMSKLRGARFAGFCTDLGAMNSHTAIVARSIGVPAVVALGNAKHLIHDGDLLVLDAQEGVVLVNPSQTVVQHYQAIQVVLNQTKHDLEGLKHVQTITRDQHPITLYANIELPEEASHAFEMGAHGIGLFRSEFLFMGRDDLPSEDEQYQAYRRVLIAAKHRPVTIRTLDIGADKTFDGELAVSPNPALGLRAIRYCMSQPQILHTQFRALLRASVHGSLQIMIPMLAHEHEILSVKHILQGVKAALDQDGIPYDKGVKLGAMIEVPAAALAIEPFIEHMDFLSIGTNDLIQYTLAIDRTDPEVAHLYEPTHPAVLRLIAYTIQQATQAGIPISVCGEMAGDTRYTELLLGLGLKIFSASAPQLLAVKQIVLDADVNALTQTVSAQLRDWRTSAH